MPSHCNTYAVFRKYTDFGFGTRAPPREIVFDNSLLPSDPYPIDLPRVATPPRTLTLDKYPFPGVDTYEGVQDVEQNNLSSTNKNANLNDVRNIQISDSFKECITGGSNEYLSSAEEVLHLRRQLAKLNRRIMALELENLNRVQKEKFIGNMFKII
ncbi:hypothetical protein NQ315_012969 [Exocentrus adspersus]|uniref:Mff-like domain-containing protein n=1 Tax=Exocentrus adspersus TaxID=1586481 RepID=A0AAV8VSI0_9CUCU|nr:hypothetical protein NQ315_012969 [Exocentrus adspersus]